MRADNNSDSKDVSIYIALLAVSMLYFITLIAYAS